MLLGGPKCSGKTTTLAHVAAATGAAIIANDRVLALPAQAKWECRGIPSLVIVRAETVAAMPQLLQGLPAVRWPGHLSLAESRTALEQHGPLRDPRRLQLSLRQFSRGLSAPVSGGAELGAIAVLRTDPHARSPYRVRPIAPAARPRALHRLAYGGADPLAPPARTVFDRFAGPGDGRAPAADLLDAVPWFEVEVGPEFLTSVQAARDLLETMAGAA
jgi:hypothetical protein